MMTAWKKVKVGDFLFEREGRYKPDSQEIAGLQRIEKIDFSGNFHIANKPSQTDMILIKPGDLVISGINVAKGALGVYHGQETVTATIHYSSYTFDKSKINVEYFKRFLKSSLFIQLLKEQVKGGIKTEIKPKHLLPLEILLPSKAEQLAILDCFLKIENEDAELKSELIHQQTLLKKLRQQILQEAIEGKLTADWRAQNPNIEPASELLKRIAAEKEQLIKDKKIKAQKPLPPITDEEKPFELPQGWVWCRSENVTVYLNGYAFKSSWFSSNGVRLVRNINVSHGNLDWSQAAFLPVEKAAEFEQFLLAEGDIVLSLDRPIISTGLKVARVNLSDLPALLLQRVLKLSPVLVTGEYFYTWIVSKLFINGINPGRSIGIPHVSHKEVADILFPLAPLAEQHAIVTKVEKLLALCDQLEAQITQNQIRAEQLMQAVLKEAFGHNNKAESASVTPQASAHA